mmetsp:Transcript_29137/g.74895  ORF Transcript_29137/g.74895 Transcript_29137/m.74895 type:complete len:199 (-) Transcript_29137:1042-1638(-)
MTRWASLRKTRWDLETPVASLFFLLLLLWIPPPFFVVGGLIPPSFFCFSQAEGREGTLSNKVGKRTSRFEVRSKRSGICASHAEVVACGSGASIVACETFRDVENVERTKGADGGKTTRFERAGGAKSDMFSSLFSTSEEKGVWTGSKKGKRRWFVLVETFLGRNQPFGGKRRVLEEDGKTQSAGELDPYLQRGAHIC